MSRVLLLRHGAVEKPAGALVGRLDLALSPEGLEQAAAWRPVLAGRNFAAVLASPLLRCRQTAALALSPEGPRPTVEPRLAEIDLGAWDGLSRAEIEAGWPGAWEARGRDFAGFRPPGGESFADLAARVTPALAEMAELARTSGRPVLAVTHAGVIRTLLCLALGRSLDEVMQIRLSYGSLSVLESASAAALRVTAVDLPPGSPLPAGGL